MNIAEATSEATRYKIKRGKLIFLNKETGDMLISSSAVPRQNCICTICTCGRHHCPEHWKPNFAETEQSEYQQNYIRHPSGFHRDPYFRERAEAVHTTAGPDHFLTTHAREYVPFNVTPCKAIAPTKQLLRRTPFEGNSTNRTEFTGKQLPERQKSAKLPVPLPPHVPFVGNSISHTDLENWYAKGKIPRAARTDTSSKRIRNDPFVANTIYRSAYQPHKGNFASTKICPMHDLPNAKDPFPYESEYDLQYREKGFKLCPVYNLPKWKASDVTGHIHYLKDKKPSPKKVETPFSPATAKLASQFALEPLSSSSTKPTSGVKS